MQSEIGSSEQEKAKLLAKKAELEAENAELLKSIIEECAENEASIAELKIAQILLNEEPIVEYCPSFLNGLELDAFFQKCQIALEVQGSQHRLNSTSWYKDVKKLESVVTYVKITEFFFLRYGMMKNQK
ncbi:hypothetical protein Glove_499g45 [Diversispora epigaea]|uniref:Uncharacterized protein n=1 Tax=Diversispora epigaea TaxID=1348612 RepID=A0A397GJP4_9GLOM|nr:hypothetical protein Glove_499g45 [Diversispora epigaea]